MRLARHIGGYLAAVCVLCPPLFVLSAESTAAAEESGIRAEAVHRKSRSKLRRLQNFFGNDFNVADQFRGEVIDVSEQEPAAAEPAERPDEQAAQPAAKTEVDFSADAPADAAPEQPEERPGEVRYVSQDPTSDPVLPLNKTPSVRLNPDAPSPFKGMVSAFRSGDRSLAQGYADQFIRYQQNFLFEVREYTQLIGEALIRQNVIEGEDWVGVSQYINYEFAKARQEEKALFKPTHDIALERVKPDERGQAGIYYFFTLNCSYCRFMAPEVERLWQVAKNDPNLEMVALTLGSVPKAWMEEYRDYTGWTVPVFSGEQLAKSFNVGFVPAIVVVAPNGKRAYLKTGQQSFTRMYELVRKVQGLPMTLSPQIEAIIDTPIGTVEVAAAKKEAKTNPALAQRLESLNRGRLVRPKKKSPTYKMERF